MPELPEVETIARGLAKRVTGDAIESVWLGQKKEPLKSPAHEIAAVLDRCRILRVHRMGKHIVFELERSAAASNPRKPPRSVSSAQSSWKRKASGGTNPTGASGTRAQWIVHLGMTGRLQVCEPSAEIEKHTHAIVKLQSGREIRFVDPRRFGRMSVAANGEFETVGIEPLEIDFERFVPLFRGRRTPIKSALLNQKLLRGVGNIYADESLFRAGIRPRRQAATVTREQLGKLFIAIKDVLKEAIKLGGSSISDYVDAAGEEGFFQLQHRVYGREGEPCLVCKTPVKRVVIAGRSSHYCPKCQR